VKKLEWSDKQLEDILQKMPQVKDRQDSHELYRNIISRIDHEPARFSRKSNWVLPSIATAFAIVLILVLGPSIFNKVDISQDSAMETELNKSELALEDMQKENTVEEKSTSQEIARLPIAKEAETDQNNMMLMQEPIANTSVILEYTDQTRITLGIPDKNAQNVVPVSVLKPYGDYIDVLVEVINTIQTEALGLDIYLLKDATFSEVTLKNGLKKIVITIPSDKNYGIGTAMENMLIQSIQETFRWSGYQEAELLNDKGEKVFLSHYGEVNTIPINSHTNKGFYLYQYDSEHPMYLVPSPRAYDSFEESLVNMQLDIAEYELIASIPSEVSFKDIQVDENNNAIITFNKGTILTTQEPFISMFHAIMLTAREFGIENVKFENTNIEMIDHYMFTHNGVSVDNRVPEAPNYISQFQ
jgi:hypothetical protein